MPTIITHYESASIIADGNGSSPLEAAGEAPGPHVL